MMKADLHMHGPIGFQPYWLKVQGYEGKNLLKLIADSCFSKSIDICAVTSEEREIPRGSIHDRLGYLAGFIKSLPKEYKADTLGKNAIVVENNGKKVYLLNGQTVLVRENGRIFDHLIVGSNRIPNFSSLEETSLMAGDRGVLEISHLIQVAEHPLCESHQGMGMDLLEEYLKLYDAIEGHNSQLIFGFPFSRLPVFQNYSRNINLRTQKFAREKGKPWVAVSDAHRIEDAGISYIEFDRQLREDAILEELKEVIRTDAFTPVCNYEPMMDWIDWVSKFKRGLVLHKEEVTP